MKILLDLKIIVMPISDFLNLFIFRSRVSLVTVNYELLNLSAIVFLLICKQLALTSYMRNTIVHANLQI